MNTFNNFAIGFFIICYAVIAMGLCVVAEKSGDARPYSSNHVQKVEKHRGNRKITLLGKTEVLIPKNFRLNKPASYTFYGIDFTLKVFSRNFARGDAVLCEIEPIGNSFDSIKFEMTYDDSPVFLEKRKWGYVGVFAIAPDSVSVWSTIHVVVQKLGKRYEYHFPIKINHVDFPKYKKILRLGEFSDVELFTKKPWLLERIKNEMGKKEKIFSSMIPIQLRSTLSHPRNYHKVTSAFYANRFYEQYEMKDGKKQLHGAKSMPHLGVDLWGTVGAPVYAIAHGKVELAEEMFYEGKQIIINHGGGMFSRYMHLSEISVREGDYVIAGQTIGRVGSSGMVTGSHLHVGVCIRRIYVDPISLLYLPIKD
ncbi:MAG: M23 family metallopeptidase [Spirochaetes bacterium]|nr:M23 family metallopeptidase [Spirochaetota bacterium]